MPVLVAPWLIELKHCSDDLSSVHPYDIVEKLWQLNYISRELLTEFRNIIRTSQKDTKIFHREESKSAVLLRLTNEITMEQFLEALFKAKFHVIALKLMSKFRQGILRFVARKMEPGPGFKQAQKIYLNTKVNTHKNVFKVNPTEACRGLYESNKLQFEEWQQKLETEEDEEIKIKLKQNIMKHANICVSCLFAALDAEITRWNTDFDWDERTGSSSKNELVRLFCQLKGYIKETPNPNIAEVGFFSRLAIAHAMTGQLTKAEEYIETAFTLSFSIPRCAELYFMYHMFVMILLFKYQKNQSGILLGKLVIIAEEARSSLQQENDDSTRYFWTRMIILRKVFCLLGLANNTELIKGRNPSQEQIDEAKEMLVEIRDMGDMESRREMFFYTAKARIAQLEGDLGSAIFCTELAIDCDQYKCFGETDQVQNYLEQLKNLVTKAQCENQQDIRNENYIGTKKYFVQHYAGHSTIIDVNKHNENTTPKKIE
ncbi:uncharacterized protein LOC127704274 [Mytilus californianus]|uniref:uncharacterized protein LOC127704274 n=1 Tax=Mytilus californianus TaxID=6549 RepID=UPI0022460FB4|nr:uncharacterized protein LOC127704274 [Mytilus californianus]XP_052064227.1 uncharacterized protein LOC127704274 [Mytilus californianus]XP_052064228.1 uncharacterized protein LOC127704274 [Mytilus californianus]